MTSGINNSAQSSLGRLSAILEEKYSIQLDPLKKQKRHIVPSWWTPPSTFINKSSELAFHQLPASLRYANPRLQTIHDAVVFITSLSSDVSLHPQHHPLVVFSSG